ncbi:hypothetical protein FKM82_009476 [Ascaphus truei]
MESNARNSQVQQLMGMSYGREILCTFLITSAVILPVVRPEGILCALHENTSSQVRFTMSHFGVLLGPSKIHCKDSNCCMGIWSVENGELQPVLLSCFPRNAVCRSELCVPMGSRSSYHCLCSSDMCNANISLPHQPISPAQAEQERCARWNLSCDWMGAAREQPLDTSSCSEHFAIYVATVTLVLILCVSVIIIVLRRQKLGGLFIRREEMQELQEMFTREDSDPPRLPVEGLSLFQVLREEGLAAHLWLGALHGEGVMIKCFPPLLKESYRQEWRILSLLKPLQHENIVRLLAAGSGSTGILEHHLLLVLQYYSEGSMRTYLSGRASDWATACRMATSLARGLAFLHADLWREDAYKPAIAHRDLSSDNVLVTADSSCVISDFGLSVVLPGYQVKNRKAQDSAAISMTGTLRYMSPEMLDGSLNLMSWETALTQADVYSLGLLLWEIFSRCNDLYAGHQAPDFRVVFLEELGPNPTLDELRSLVVENKRRPQLPKTWGGNVQLSLALWETLEDCWDPDSEARLTAQCAEQRLCNLCPSPVTLLAPTDTVRHCPVR